MLAKGRQLQSMLACQRGLHVVTDALDVRMELRMVECLQRPALQGIEQPYSNGGPYMKDNDGP